MGFRNDFAIDRGAQDLQAAVGPDRVGVGYGLRDIGAAVGDVEGTASFHGFEYGHCSSVCGAGKGLGAEADDEDAAVLTAPSAKELGRDVGTGDERCEGESGDEDNPGAEGHGRTFLSLLEQFVTGLCRKGGSHIHPRRRAQHNHSDTRSRRVCQPRQGKGERPPEFVRHFLHALNCQRHAALQLVQRVPFSLQVRTALAWPASSYLGLA